MGGTVKAKREKKIEVNGIFGLYVLENSRNGI